MESVCKSTTANELDQSLCWIKGETISRSLDSVICRSFIIFYSTVGILYPERLAVMSQMVD